MQQGAREALCSRQGLGEIAAASLASFGLLSAAFQVALAVWPSLARHDVWILISLAGSCLIAGIAHAWPKLETNHHYNHPDFSIKVKCGDVLNEQGNIIVGFTDTFDTEMNDGVVIDPNSVQGQFQTRYYNGNITSLDSEISERLHGIPILCSETAADKHRGKLDRYAIGTTIALNKDSTRIYAVAYGFMRNDLRVSCSVDALWRSLTSAWDAVRTSGGLAPVAVPIIGSDLARIGSLDRTSLIKMIALSFVASSRQDIVSRQLTIIVHPKDRLSVNLMDVEKFLKSL
ncbi:macro domain-containing protein [Streptomyces sp. ME109]|uniref:macro domain-containing protein n=1 Tax=Streptomyces sp. me109 TaxID=1827853 RepID=UPI0011CD8336|nr:macro domain-containing protein [Streptomyces sp. me109]